VCGLTSCQHASCTERGLYFHEIWRGDNGGSMLCGTMPRNVQDLDFLHHQEGVNVILNVRSPGPMRSALACLCSAMIMDRVVPSSECNTCYSRLTSHSFWFPCLREKRSLHAPQAS